MKDREILEKPKKIELGRGSKAAKPAPRPKIKKMKRKDYEELIAPLHVEMVKLQNYIREKGLKILTVWEGRDAAGKGGTLKRVIEHMNPRFFRVVALNKPTDEERSQWYFQRYVRHLPMAGELALYDRSWYNRAGVERVMGFCKENQVREFLRTVPEFERMLVRSGIVMFKFWFSVSKEEQLRRFNSRLTDPLKQWKLSPVDKESQDKWADYTTAKEDMFFYTDTPDCPWTIIKSDDKKRARINTMRFLCNQIDYPNKSGDLTVDPRIVRTVQDEIGIE